LHTEEEYQTTMTLAAHGLGEFAEQSITEPSIYHILLQNSNESGSNIQTRSN
jgi:hypothetical protein